MMLNDAFEDNFKIKHLLGEYRRKVVKNVGLVIFSIFQKLLLSERYH